MKRLLSDDVNPGEDTPIMRMEAEWMDIRRDWMEAVGVV